MPAPTSASILGVCDMWNFPSDSHSCLPGSTPDNPDLHQIPSAGLDFLPSYSAAAPTQRGDQMTASQHMPMSGMADMSMMDALQRQTAFIEGDPGDQDLELFYYRFVSLLVSIRIASWSHVIHESISQSCANAGVQSGPTAMYPGIHRISLKLQRRNDSSSTMAAAPQPDSQLSPPPVREPVEMFDASGMPFPHIYEPLFDLFFTHLSQHFPSISRQRMRERFDSGTMSQFLANCICALGA